MGARRVTSPVNMANARTLSIFDSSVNDYNLDWNIDTSTQRLSEICSVMKTFLFVIPFYLQSVLVHSANCVNTYTVACRRVLSSAPL
jgi:hypothetical protein